MPALRIVERIEEQVATTKLPLVAITLAAVPCPDTPVILTLHWHGFVRQKADVDECFQAFGTFPFGLDGNQVVVSEAPDAEDLVELATRRGYLMWAFRPVKGGIWAEYTDDATLGPEGRRDAPCPHPAIPPVCAGKRQTIYRFGVAGSTTYN
jgi:hypothetical protein